MGGGNETIRAFGCCGAAASDEEAGACYGQNRAGPARPRLATDFEGDRDFTYLGSAIFYGILPGKGGGSAKGSSVQVRDVAFRGAGPGFEGGAVFLFEVAIEQGDVDEDEAGGHQRRNRQRQ